MIQQRAVTWQKRTCNFQGYRMPQFAFFCLLIDFEAIEFVNFIFELYNKSDFSGGPEPPLQQEAFDP